ncbi:MAG TPA: class E sortase [Solirubrobacteraceae bacterium]|nr:class E sortase [Solirubrobacteraceae bacterium]
MTQSASLLPPPLSAGPRRRSVWRRLLRDLSWVFMISGTLLLIDAGVTLLWQEPLTYVVGLVKKGEINQRYLNYRTAPLSPLDQRALSDLHALPRRIAYLARREQRQVPTGAALGHIDIPKIGANYTVVEGTDELSLEEGPGHYPSTALPGLNQTVAIAGHRTTYLAPFRHIDALRPGDRIILTMPYARFAYSVQFTRIVLPTAWWVTRDVGYDRLVLSACNPLYSAAQRIVVFARLMQTVPLGAARAS